MYYPADTATLVAQGILTPTQADIIKARARQAMVALSMNTLLIFGIIAAALGLVFWLADAAAVALTGTVALVAGLLVLTRGAAAYRIFGNASALIGAGMLTCGAAIKLAEITPSLASPGMLAIGAVLSAAALWMLARGPARLGFSSASILVMGATLTVVGIYFGVRQYAMTGTSLALAHLLVCTIAVAVGWRLDLRVVTALAIVPFAQMIDTGTFYAHALYAFYSPEPTISILQMAALIAACIWLMRNGSARTQRQAGILAIMAFVVANLCALVGSLWGDVVGLTLWGPVRADMDYDVFIQLRSAFEGDALTIAPGVYALIWAACLAGMAVWAALANRRGLFKTAVTFGAIHAYTRMFESFDNAPLTIALCGLTAIPLAWGLWRLNDRFDTTD